MSILPLLNRLFAIDIEWKRKKAIQFSECTARATRQRHQKREKKNSPCCSMRSLLGSVQLMKATPNQFPGAGPSICIRWIAPSDLNCNECTSYLFGEGESLNYWLIFSIGERERKLTSGRRLGNAWEMLYFQDWWLDSCQLSSAALHLAADRHELENAIKRERTTRWRINVNSTIVIHHCSTFVVVSWARCDALFPAPIIIALLKPSATKQRQHGECYDIPDQLRQKINRKLEFFTTLRR